MTTEELYAVYQQYPSVQTDTRKLIKGDIFFALKGANFNANTFVERAFEAGASYAVIDDPKYSEFSQTILVDDVLTSLQQLAKYHRQQFAIPFIAITGSNGKTTTKDLVHAVLSSHLKTYTTEGNLNNHIGVPLSILKIKKEAEIAVIEMGANHVGEIASLCNYAMPTHGIITNCGKAHLEGFGGLEGVRKGKGELFDYLRSNKGTVFIMSDYDYLGTMSQGMEKMITYGTANADIIGVADTNNDFLKLTVTKGADVGTIQTKIVGDYNLPNVLAAIAIGKHFEVPDNKIKEAIENYTPTNSRSQLIQRTSNKIIMDAYNANPSSMKLAIENFALMQGDQKVLLLGAMAELGDQSPAEHELLMDLINKYNWKNVVLVGGDFSKIKHPYLQFNTSDEAKEWLAQQPFENTLFLLKGSRSMEMEKLLDAIK